MQPDEDKYWKKIEIPSLEGAKECLNTNYYGAKRMVEAFISLLQLSDSPRIINVSSLKGRLMVKEYISLFTYYSFWL